MKKIHRLTALLLALLLCLALSGCRRQEDPDPQPDPPVTDPDPQPDPQPDPPVTDPDPQPDDEPGVTVGELTLSETYADENGEELLRVSVTAPSPSGSEAMEQIAAYYDAWLEDIRYYCETMLTETAREGMAWAKEGGGVFNPYALESDYQLTRLDGAVFSVIRDQYESTGGIHPSYAMMAETFDVQNGGRMSVFTLFSSMDEQQVLDLIREKVLDIAQSKLDAQPDLYFENYETLLMDTFDPLCFALTDSGLTLYWQTYTIGPYVSGVQRFDIPYDELAGSMDGQWMPS